jgi:rare lipoprotein A
VRALIVAIALAVAGSAALGTGCAGKQPAKARRARFGAIGSQQVGQASWYGGRHHGGPTASGERFNKNALTAAHKTLRMHTRVKVVHRRTGRSVVVRINDRGPYARGRIIDLSEAAAKRLGILKEGVAPVTITVVGRGKPK